ncbi:MAG: 4-alpha-glucanotransferase, partial [Rubrobacter sp.]|nr:4-alpha-glucanotransferase [Rubrobacter sp.]
MMADGRRAGILLHPTSLPGEPGGGCYGELGGEAVRFVEFLREAGQRSWQVLPLNPPDHAGSPYSSDSAFAGSPSLVSVERLVRDGLVRRGEVSGGKEKILRTAFERCGETDELSAFREENRDWLADYALYRALRRRLGRPWNRWPRALARREAGALRQARRELAEEAALVEFAQYLFEAHWSAVRREANRAGIEVIGDVPIFVSHDSADVWANQRLFRLDEFGEPSVTAGVPPDYFSGEGQLWGNPIYDWRRMAEEGYEWWTRRVRRALALYDTVRMDHFRGFVAHWEAPAGARTAAEGEWAAGPGAELFEAIRDEVGELPFIAEDLGEITPDVEALRDGLGLPGMDVLQFAFSGPDSEFLPHNYLHPNRAVYTGTHDNDTTAGWWKAAP